ncbi:hypothetical protein HAX54_039458 [Datura stramonium]|uniref:Uncharacterized protein n=1 Tax=Datura stramonium TaxID=4076 RepID=A0ABS8VPW0_DATST|nr:hypothetical protein [Datura stramonium]
MENVTGHVSFKTTMGRVHVYSGNGLKMWRSDIRSDNGGWLSADVYVDITEQKWHANLKIVNLFVPSLLFLIALPDVDFHSPACSNTTHIFGEDMSPSLCFRAQRIFLHNTSGWCLVRCSFRSFWRFWHRQRKRIPSCIQLAGSVTAVFNCQGPLDIPIFVGSALVSRKIANLANEFPKSAAYEAVVNNKEAGAVAAIDRVPFSYISANFTFNTDNCVADLYGIRASLIDGGEIRGAGNAWICPEVPSFAGVVLIELSDDFVVKEVLHNSFLWTWAILVWAFGSCSRLCERYLVSAAQIKAQSSVGHHYLTYAGNNKVSPRQLFFEQ